MSPKTRCVAAACLAALVASGRTGVLRAQSAPGPAVPAATSAADQPAGQAELSPAEQLAGDQRQVAARFRHLQDVLLRMAELTAATDPRRAALLKKAVAQSEQRLIGVQFDTLVDLLREDRLSRAIENQAGVAQDLEALLELLLSENRADRIQSEKARIREYLKQLNEIIKRQKGIQGRTAGTGDAQRLAGQQGQLAEKTGGLGREIQANEKPAAPPKGAGGKGQPDQKNGDGASDSKNEGASKDSGGGVSGEKSENGGKGQGESQERESKGGRQDGGGNKPPNEGKSPGQTPGQGQGQAHGQGGGQPSGRNQPQDQDQQPAQKRIEAAEQRMREAQQKLEEAQREGAVQKQEEAIRELEEAKAELEEILRQLREEEIARALAMLESRFRRMLQMQQDVYDGTLRLDKVPAAERDHNHEIESSRLGSKEAEIVLEADKALAILREDGTAVAFPEAVGQMREDMEQVVQRLAQAKVGQLTQAIEQDIIAALEEMIEALQKAQEDLEKSRRRPRDARPSRPQDPPLVDLLAEIKMIRALQMRVNRRTAQYSKLVEGEQAENPELLEALDRLAERQARITKVTRDLELGKNQ